MKKLVTHPNGFHADDVTAYAILKEVLTKRGESWSLTRSREPEVIAAGDIVFDVGDVYDASTNRYDHHQRGRAGARDNGVVYASCGLVWKHFGKELCSNDWVWESVDRSLIQEIDAVDNGQNYVGELLFKDAGYTSFGIHLANFESTMFEPSTPGSLVEQFERASEFARGVLTRMIHANEAINRAFMEASDAYAKSADKQILVIDKNYSRPIWRMLSAFPELIYVVYPNEYNGTWKAEAINITATVLGSRKPYPEAWWGLKGKELADIAGVADAGFCHPSGFLLGADSKEGTIVLAKKSLMM